MVPARAACVLFLFILQTSVAAGDIVFVKTHIDSEFRSEGVAVADVDGDGRKDILAGALWYKAPEWSAREIAPVQKFVPEKGYSNSFCCFAEDLNGDGSADLIVVGYPGAPVRIYINPGPGILDVHWKKYEAFGNCSNESPVFVDLNGDGKRELVCGSDEERMFWYAPGEKVSQAWKGHAFSDPKAVGAQRYSHGLGVGDVNGDGRLDVLVIRGWYESPASGGGSSERWKYHADFPPSPIHVKEAHPQQPGRLLEDRPSGHDCAHMFAYDFDGDGDKDVLASSAHNFGIWWLEQTGDTAGGAKWTAHAIDTSYSQLHALVPVDLNKDGLPDIVTGKRWYAHQGHDPGGNMPAVLCWYELRRGDRPRWIRHLIDSDSGVGTQFEVADVNGDGREDIVISNKKGVFYFEQRRLSSPAK